jgi:hypothetical protein
VTAALQRQEIVQIVVAGATVLLAIATFAMARRTHQVAKRTAEEAEAVVRQAEAAYRQVEVSSAALSASIRPWLSADMDETARRPDLVDGTDESPSIEGELRLVNIGRGLALITESHLLGRTDPEDTEPRRLVRGTSGHAPLRPGEGTLLWFDIPLNSADWVNLSVPKLTGQPQRAGDFYVEVHYTDSEGDQGTWARIHVFNAGKADHNIWHIHEISYHRDPEDEPFARSVFA